MAFPASQIEKMTMHVQDLQDLLRLLDEHPEWLEALRQRILTREWITLPGEVRLLAREIHAFAEKVDRLVDLAYNQMQDMAEVRGRLREMDFREKAPAFLGPHGFYRVKVLSMAEIMQQIDAAEEAGRISPKERAQILQVDAIVQARYRRKIPVYLVVEVSEGVGLHDVERAFERARIWAKIHPEAMVWPLVAGRFVAPEAHAQARKQQVLILRDGHLEWTFAPPEDTPIAA